MHAAVQAETSNTKKQPISPSKQSLTLDTQTVSVSLKQLK